MYIYFLCIHFMNFFVYVFSLLYFNLHAWKNIKTCFISVVIWLVNLSTKYLTSTQNSRSKSNCFYYNSNKTNRFSPPLNKNKYCRYIARCVPNLMLIRDLQQHREKLFIALLDLDACHCAFLWYRFPTNVLFPTEVWGSCNAWNVWFIRFQTEKVLF